jgi:hypothetical protein
MREPLGIENSRATVAPCATRTAAAITLSIVEPCSPSCKALRFAHVFRVAFGP